MPRTVKVKATSRKSAKPSVVKKISKKSLLSDFVQSEYSHKVDPLVSNMKMEGPGWTVDQLNFENMIRKLFAEHLPTPLQKAQKEAKDMGELMDKAVKHIAEGKPMKSLEDADLKYEPTTLDLIKGSYNTISDLGALLQEMSVGLSKVISVPTLERFTVDQQLEVLSPSGVSGFRTVIAGINSRLKAYCSYIDFIRAEIAHFNS
jgi:hypothetical protein